MLDQPPHTPGGPIHPLECSPHNFPLTINEESLRMALNTVRSGYLSIFVDQDGRRDMEFTLVFSYIIRFGFNGHFEKD